MPPQLGRRGIESACTDLLAVDPPPTPTDHAPRPSSPSLSSDITLAAAVLRRDRKATAAFVEAYADAVHSYVRSRLLPRGEAIEDLTHDVFVAALQSLSTYRGESSLRTWVLAIARHKVEDHYRAQFTQVHVPLAHEADEFAAVPSLDDAADRETLAKRTEAIIEALPARHRSLLLWRYWERRSTRDIAAHLGKTEKSIERLLARARQAFKKRWRDER